MTFMERVMPVVDETIRALAKTSSYKTPVAGLKYSRATSDGLVGETMQWPRVGFEGPPTKALQTLRINSASCTSTVGAFSKVCDRRDLVSKGSRSGRGRSSK